MLTSASSWTWTMWSSSVQRQTYPDHSRAFWSWWPWYHWRYCLHTHTHKVFYIIFFLYIILWPFSGPSISPFNLLFHQPVEGLPVENSNLLKPGTRLLSLLYVTLMFFALCPCSNKDMYTIHSKTTTMNRNGQHRD